MENQKFQKILDGIPTKLDSHEIMEFGVFCSGQNLPLQHFIHISVIYFAMQANPLPSRS